MDENDLREVGRTVKEYTAEDFGPNGEAVLALIERARNITPTEASGLIAAWDAAWDAAWRASRNAARSAAWDAEWDAFDYAAWDAAWRASRHAAWDAAWRASRNAARSAAWDAAWDAAWRAARNASRSAAWNAVRDAAGDAAAAMVVKDLIIPEHFDALYSPWASVMEKESGQ
jgi:hypothetical protein